LLIANFCNLFNRTRHLQFDLRCLSFAAILSKILFVSTVARVLFVKKFKYQFFGGDMLFKSKFTRVIAIFCLTFTLSVAAFADTIRLKDGSIIKGKIVSFGGGKFVVLIGSRQLTYAASEVESIEFEADSLPAAVNNSSVPPVKTEASTVITVGQTKSNPEVQTSAPPVVTNQATKPAVKPIELNVKVLADNTANGWTNSGWVVRKGQRIRISGTGQISLGGGRSATPGGVASLPDAGKLKKDEPTGGLIAVIGDNNNDFIFIGASREFIAERDGALFLGVNEGNLDDNAGVFDVKIEISPES
jgi:hypothetical protein